jgi:hypothetical protein
MCEFIVKEIKRKSLLTNFTFILQPFVIQLSYLYAILKKVGMRSTIMLLYYA